MSGRSSADPHIPSELADAPRAASCDRGARQVSVASCAAASFRVTDSAVAAGDREKSCEKPHVLINVAAGLHQQGLQLIELDLGVVITLDTGGTGKLGHLRVE